MPDLALLSTNWFQFTHPGGVRLRRPPHYHSCRYCFNSRTREGCDAGEVLRLTDVVVVSIHAPGRGATGRMFTTSSAPHVSIHAPGRGATSPSSSSPTGRMFQFTHPGGVRRYGAKLRIMGRINKRNLRLEVLL